MEVVKELIAQGEGRPFRDVLLEKGFPIELTLLEFIKFQLKYIIPQTLSDGELTLLAYMHLNPRDYIEQYMADGHSRSSKSIDNYLCKLRKEGLLTSDRKLHPDIFLTQDPTHYIYFFNIK